MRDFKGMKRQRGRNRKPGGGNANAANPNRSWDSQGPENIKVRGNAQTVYERYQQLARDAASSGDRVLAENYLQHAEHYFRVLRALQPARPVSEIAARELAGQGFDIDFEDESGAQAAAFLAAQQAAERAAQQQAEPRDGDGQPREAREWQPRPPRDNQARDTQDGQPNGQARADGEQGEGGRRETRRERWERRREERNRRFEAEGGVGDAGADEDAEGRTESGRETGDFIASTAPLSYSPPVEAGPVLEAQPAFEAQPVFEAEPAQERPARRTRTPRAPASDDVAQALPGFLTRSSAPAVGSEDDAGDAPAPRRRSPRKKVEAPADGE